MRASSPGDFLHGLSVTERRRGWELMLSDPGQAAHTLVVEVEHAVDGFANVGPCRDDDADAHTGELRAIYLDSSHWHRGVGRSLLAEVMAILSNDGYQRATLWVLCTNARARSFYQRAGWSLDDATKLDHINGVALEEVRYLTSLA